MLNTILRLLTLGLGLLRRPAPSPPPVASGPDQIARDVLSLINTERVRHGLTPLAANPYLGQEASRYARRMAEAETLSHDLDGTLISRLVKYPLPALWLWGENIAEGYGTAATVVVGWLASPPHRSNILDPKFQMSGVGVSADRKGRLYFDQLFVD